MWISLLLIKDKDKVLDNCWCIFLICLLLVFLGINCVFFVIEISILWLIIKVCNVVIWFDNWNEKDKLFKYGLSSVDFLIKIVVWLLYCFCVNKVSIIMMSGII